MQIQAIGAYQTKTHLSDVLPAGANLSSTEAEFMGTFQ